MAPTHYTDVTVIGTPAEVGQLLHAARGSGRLLAATPARPVSATDPRLRLTVRLGNQATATAAATRRPTRPARPPIPPPRPWYPPPTPDPYRRRLALIPIAAAAALALLASLVYGLYLIVTAAVAAIAAALPYLLGVLVLIALLAAAIRSAGGGGRHCPGCPD